MENGPAAAPPQTMSSTTTPTAKPTPAVLVHYDSGPAGEIAATEAGVAALAHTRKWVLLLGIGLFVYAAVSALGGAGALFLAYVEGGEGEVDFEAAPFIIIGFGNLIFAALALIAGLLLMRFWSAAGRTIRLRRPEDLEGVLIAQHRLWRFVCLALIVVLALPFLVIALLIARDPNFP